MKPLNGNTRAAIGTLADERLKVVNREIAEALTRLRNLSREKADLEILMIATGVETVTVTNFPSEEGTPE
jgi:hypothetical protein